MQPKIIYVPGEMNPAEHVTKKTSIEKYLNNPFLQQGPKFLKDDTEIILRKYETSKNMNMEHKEKAEKELKPKLKINNNIVKNDLSPKETVTSLEETTPSPSL